MKLNDETTYGRGFLGVPQKKPNSVSIPVAKKSNTQMKHSFSNNYKQIILIVMKTPLLFVTDLVLLFQQQQQQCSAAWGRQTKSTQSVTQHQQQVQSSVGRTTGLGNGRCSRTLGLPPSAWPPLQQQNQNGSGMGAVFLNGSGARRESSGTGVFIPLRMGLLLLNLVRSLVTCSAALLPARVVQALNLNFEEMGLSGPQTRYVGGFGHGNALLSQHQSITRK
ncbi:hypothetical protein AQUCO_10300005v1, partial [Aquilegia coerulea]